MPLYTLAEIIHIPAIIIAIKKPVSTDFILPTRSTGNGNTG